MKLVFATDIHGSEVIFRKFINSAAFYKADVLILGGDITGKAICPIVKTSKGHEGKLFGRSHVMETEKELQEFERNVRFNGFYPYHCTPNKVAWLGENPDHVQEAFIEAMKVTKQKWVEWADERLARDGIECFVVAGNDDPYELDEVLGKGERLHLINQKRVKFRDWDIFGYPISNRTPWDSPREKDEPDIKTDLMDGCDPDTAGCQNLILNVHVPPFGSGLDAAPELTPDLKIVVRGGMESTTPVGSTAVNEFIEKYQPLLCLSGHIHESRATARIGRTVCLNPGSRYNEGTLQAALVEVKGSDVVQHQMVTG